MTRWNTSGSVPSASAIEPFTSAKSTVTCLRSPVSVVRAARILSARCAGVAGSAAAGRGVAGAPHSPQNFMLAASSAWHWPQRRTMGVPHSWQNFVAAGFSCAQAGQAMLATVFTRAPSM